MKKLYLLGIALLAASFTFAQVIQKTSVTDSYAENVTKYTKSGVSHNTISPKGRHNTAKAAVLSEDFSSETFPPEGWTVINGAESAGTLQWGRATNLTLGSQGNLVAGEYAYIDWQNNGSVANQDEWLITPEITIPAGATLNFEMYTLYRYFIASLDGDFGDFLVKISDDNGTSWTTIWNEDDYYAAAEPQTGAWNQIVVDLAAYSGRSVKIAFNYVGRDACWLLVDNVVVDAVAEYDFGLTDAAAKINPRYINYGYNGRFANFPRREINQYSRVAFEGVVNNFGSADVTVKMVAKVFNPNNQEIFSYDFANVTVPGGSFDANGNYIAGIDTIVYYTESTEEEGSYEIIPESIFMMENMVDDGTYRFEISLEPVGFTYDNANGRQLKHEFTTKVTDDCLYSRDDNNYSGSNYEANDANWNSFTVFATKYQVWNPEDVLQYIEAYISEAEEGTEFHYAIYVDTEDSYSEVLTTESYTVGADFTPGYIRLASEDLVEMSGTLTEEGSYLDIMAAVVVDNGKGLSVGVSEADHETFYENMAMNADNWYRITGTEGYLMIRIFLCEPENPGPYAETFEANEIEMYPNPTTGIVNFSNVENATIEVFNMMGQVISRVENANENTTIDLSTVANGNYVVRIVMNGEVSTSKLNIAR